MRLSIEPSACQGHAVCSVTAPALVDFDDEGHAVPHHETLPDHLIDAARRMRLSCPERAVSLVD
ncbi:ferredoxin [Gordonia insulae]|uniref:Ferredoxin n=1 Tax=Gordonia insulae TaxID=2420509 RepID=A0A3G8JK60_9ACTN|nr:hypothetical protein D7316_02012 [Gordonia insulae]